MAADFLAIFAGFCLFFLVTLLPGYAFGWLTGVLQFRSRTLPFRLAASVPLAIAIGPILSYTVGGWLSLDAVWVVYFCLCTYSVYLLLARTDMRNSLALFRQLRVFFVAIGVWLAVATLSLMDMQFGRRLYYSVIGFDYSIRTAFTESIATYGIPARNPFFFPGHSVGLRYHYFWIILSALVHRLGAGLVDARQAFVAGTLWCGIGLICLIPLSLRILGASGEQNLRRRSLAGIALLAVTGLDILPALLMVVLQRVGIVEGISPSVEWWNNQVDGWLYTMLWEPHYLCAVIACLSGFLILWDGRGRMVSAIVAGLAFASAAGSGIYVAFVFAVFLGTWTSISVVKKWYREAGAIATAGLVALGLTAFYIRSLGVSPGTSSGSLFQLTIRSFDLGELFLKVFRLDRPSLLAAGNALMLPLNYFLELGFFLAAGVIVFVRFRTSRRAATRAELALFTMFVTSIAICTFLKSGVVSNNDLGWRGFLIAQFVLLLCGAEVLSGAFAAFSKRQKAVLQVLLVLGGAGVVYDLAILRVFPVLSDAGRVPLIGWLAADRQGGLRNYANREAYEWLRARTSASAVIQQNPEPALQDTLYGLYGQRQTVAADGHCLTDFGGNPAECKPIVKSLQEVYLTSGKLGIEAACKTFPIDVFLVKDTDAVWKNSAGWVWTKVPVFQNQTVRLFACHPL